MEILTIKDNPDNFYLRLDGVYVENQYEYTKNPRPYKFFNGNGQFEAEKPLFIEAEEQIKELLKNFPDLELIVRFYPSMIEKELEVQVLNYSHEEDKYVEIVHLSFDSCHYIKVESTPIPISLGQLFSEL